jgi:hypothetical protein
MGRRPLLGSTATVKVRVLEPGRRWAVSADAGELVVQRFPEGGWAVVLGGFSRSAGTQLADAIATASAAGPTEE